MSNFRLRRDMHIELRGREFIINERLPNGDIRLTDVALNESEAVSQDALLDALFDGQMEFLGDGRQNSLVGRKMAESFIEDIVMLKDADPRKKEFKRRHAYVKAIQEAKLTKFRAATLEPIIRRVHEEIKDPKRLPNWRTAFYGWFMPYLRAGEDVRAYVPSFKKRGNRKHKFTGGRKRKGQKFSEAERRKAEEVAGVVRDVINEEFMNEQRLSVAEVYRKLEERIDEINETRNTGDRLPLPHSDSIYDIVVKMDEYEKDRARYGKLYAEKIHEQKKRGPRPTRPLQRVEMDHTKLDLFVVDPVTRLPLGRPTISAEIDKFSRMIVGIHVGFDPASYLSVMLCLLNAIRPKSYLKTDYPDVENEWDTYGIPEVLVVDNGPEFHSEDLENACLQIGTVIMYNPVRHPWFKSSIERFFGTENRRLLHNQPGTTFSNIIDREDYDPQKNAVIDFDRFMEMLHIWLVDDYSQEIHRGLGDIPSHVWKAGIKESPPRLPRRGQDLKVVLGKIERRKIGPKGIRLFNLIYNDDNLAALRRELKGERAALKFNPDDLSIIHVHNPKDDSYIPVPAEDQEYTKHLSLWQHEVICAYARKDTESRRDAKALIRARKKIQAIVDREWQKIGKSGAKSKMARWNRVRQRNYSATLEMSEHPDEQSQRRDEAKGTLVMLNSAPPPAETLSDIGRLPSIEGKSGESNETGVRLLPGTAKVTVIAKSPEAKKGRAVTSTPKVDNAAARQEPAGSADAASESMEDDELDLAGYSASYRLPAHGGVNG
jgi:putative transposase